MRHWQRLAAGFVAALALAGCVFEASAPLDDGLVAVSFDRILAPGARHFAINDEQGRPEAIVRLWRGEAAIQAFITRRPRADATTLSRDSFQATAIFAVPGTDGLFLARRGTRSVSYLAFLWPPAGPAWLEVPRTLPAAERSIVNRLNPLSGGAVGGFNTVQTQEALLMRARLLAERPAYTRTLVPIDEAAYVRNRDAWQAQIDRQARVAADLYCAPLRTSACLVEGQACRRLGDGRMIYATLGGGGWYFRDGRRVPPAQAGNRECPAPGGG